MHTDIRIAMLFLVGLSIAGSLFIIVTDDVLGVPTQETVTETDNTYPIAMENQRATHTKDDYLVWGHAPDGDAINVTYKEVGSDTWNDYTIHTSGDDGSYKFAGVVNTQNNTLVLLYCVKISTYVDVYIAIKWPGSDWDTWTLVKIGGNRLPGDIGVNDTNIIGIACTLTTSTYNIYLWYFDLETMTRDPDGDNGSPTSTATTHFASVQVQVNMTGVFFYTYQHTSWGTEWRDFELTFAKQTIAPVNWWLSSIECLENDMFIGVGQYSHTGRPYNYRQTSILQMGYWTRTYLEQSGSGCVLEYDAISVSVKQNSTVLSIITYCNTDEEIVTWSGNWDYTEIQWDGARTHTGVSDTDDVAFLGNFGGLWPIHASTGIRWTRPQGGYAFFARDENGTDDTLDYVYDGINWTGDLTTGDPEISTVALPNGEYDVYWSHTLTGICGTAPYTWTLLIGPGWMSLGPVNGTLYGVPDGTGSTQVRVKLADGIPRYVEKQWTLTIGAAEVSSDFDPDPSVAWALWWGDPACISTVMIVAVIALFGFLIIRSRM